MKLSHTFAIATYGALLFTLSGCGWLVGEKGYIRDSREDYRDSQAAAPLELPEGADSSAIRELYYIPGADQVPVFKDDKFKVPRPDTQIVSAPKELKVYKTEHEYRIVMEGAPNEVWARIRQFWKVNNIGLASNVPSRGLMETDWLKDSSEGHITRNKFQVIVEYGLQESISEIYIKHLSYDDQTVEIQSQDLDWSKAEVGNKLALGMTKELSSFLTRTKTDAAPVSLLARELVGEPKASLNTDLSGELVINIKLSYDRAWNALGKAIDTAGYELKNRDRNNGLYYLAVTTDEKETKKGGFFSFLSFGKSDGEGAYHSMTLKVQQNAGIVKAFISEYEESPIAPLLRKDVLERIKRELI